MEFTRTLPWPDWEIAGVLGTGGFGAVYEIRIPFELFDREIAEITVPVTVVSQYKLK